MALVPPCVIPQAESLARIVQVAAPESGTRRNRDAWNSQQKAPFPGSAEQTKRPQYRQSTVLAPPTTRCIDQS